MEIELEQGWEIIERGITRLKNILEGLPEPKFSSANYMELYTTVYNMCTQKPPHDYSQQLYDRYRESIEDYINSMVLPSLREKHDEFVPRELVKRWANHKVLVRWLSHIFHYLNREFIPRRSLLPLREVGFICFRTLVFYDFYRNLRVSVLSLIDQEREGEEIDRALLKNAVDIFVEIGMGRMDYYVHDLEAYMLRATVAYYSDKASHWIQEDSCPDYMLKVEQRLTSEKDRVSHYLHPSSEPKLLEKVQNELLSVHGIQLLTKEHSGFHVLLRDDQVEDLSRMFRLFSRLQHRLQLVSDMLWEHVTDEFPGLVQRAEDAASNNTLQVKDDSVSWCIFSFTFYCHLIWTGFKIKIILFSHPKLPVDSMF
ncbi:unnamed protein product [Linum tenue]|uniref:Cullin N-terminal domain-containing protein n=2 Tax=Linum tenue TaxID=586396 RepID=A0AAV0PAN4_9ROSI|nr:unnamed protein product [Linum tenue]